MVVRKYGKHAKLDFLMSNVSLYHSQSVANEIIVLLNKYLYTKFSNTFVNIPNGNILRLVIVIPLAFLFLQSNIRRFLFINLSVVPIGILVNNYVYYDDIRRL